MSAHLSSTVNCLGIRFLQVLVSVEEVIAVLVYTSHVTKVRFSSVVISFISPDLCGELLLINLKASCCLC